MGAAPHKYLENGHSCQYDDNKINALVETNQEVSKDIGVLVSKIDTIIEHNRVNFRYLLLVLCLIALGEKAMELVERFWGKEARAYTVEAKP